MNSALFPMLLTGLIYLGLRGLYNLDFWVTTLPYLLRSIILCVRVCCWMAYAAIYGVVIGLLVFLTYLHETGESLGSWLVDELSIPIVTSPAVIRSWSYEQQHHAMGTTWTKETVVVWTLNNDTITSYTRAYWTEQDGSCEGYVSSSQENSNGDVLSFPILHERISTVATVVLTVPTLTDTDCVPITPTIVKNEESSMTKDEIDAFFANLEWNDLLRQWQSISTDGDGCPTEVISRIDDNDSCPLFTKEEKDRINYHDALLELTDDNDDTTYTEGENTTTPETFISPRSDVEIDEDMSTDDGFTDDVLVALCSNGTDEAQPTAPLTPVNDDKPGLTAEKLNGMHWVNIKEEAKTRKISVFRKSRMTLVDEILAHDKDNNA